jgi:hypothetical protein
LDLYPNIAFIIDLDDIIGGYERINTLEGSPKISDFKINTTIKRIRVTSFKNGAFRDYNEGN